MPPEWQLEGLHLSPHAPESLIEETLCYTKAVRILPFLIIGDITCCFQDRLSN